MIRKNIYLTEKQVQFVTQYINKEGGGTETDVIRKALDYFIECKSSSLGNLLLQGFSIKNLYVEISPRAAGKTYRLIKKATEFLSEDSKNKVNIVTPSDRVSIGIKKAIGEYFKNRIFINEKWQSDRDLNIKCYYDEFDQNEALKEVDFDGYYCSSLSKTRNLANLDKNDFLLKLLKENDYKYVTYCRFDDYKHLELDTLDNESREMGFENRVFKYEKVKSATIKLHASS